ncbi:MAG: hypothetical protein IKY57_02190 [Alistipes sp.]|nr:hypothetical protein [Alistipes sp.]
MKNLKMLYIALVALVASTLGACTTDFEAGPQASGPQVSFAPENAKSVDFTGNVAENTQSLTLARVDTKEALTVFVLSEVTKGAESFFTIPETVSFAAGEATTQLVYTVDQSKFANDTNYTVTFYIEEEFATPYGYAEWTVNHALNPWELLKDSKGNNAKGKFRGAAAFDGFWSGVENLGVDLDVNIYQHKQLKQYKIEDPWVLAYTLGLGAEKPEDLSSQFSWTNADLIVDYTDPNNVKIPAQSIGISEDYYGYGEGYIQAEGGTLVEGIITFPVEGIGFAHLNATGGRLLPCNTSGMFRIVLPGVELADYSLAVAYEGMDVAADNKTATAKLKFTYGDDVTGVKYLVVNGNVEKNPADALDILVAGTDENILSIEDFVQGGKEANIKAGLETGLYTVVAVPVDKAGALRAKEVAAKSFYFPGLGAPEEHPCEFNAALVLPSTYNPALTASYPDETSLVYMAMGTELANVRTYINKTSTIATWTGTAEELVAAYGSDVSAAVLDKINSENGYAGVYTSLAPGTEYTMIFVATNDYGETTTKVVSCSTKAIEINYNGELAIGQYYMNCTVNAGTEQEVSFDNLFEVIPVGDSETEFVVKNFGVNLNGMDINWLATYDSAAKTLTLSGLEQGYEEYGCQFAVPYAYVDQAQTQALVFFSFATQDSEGADPCVLTVDETSKQVNGLQNLLFAAQVLDLSSGSPLATWGYYTNELTTIAPYTEAAPSSVKSNSYAKLSFSSVVVPVNKFRSLKASNISLESAAVKSVNSVKPLVVEGYTREVGKFQRAKANIR